MFNGLKTEIRDITKPVHFLWTAGIPNLVIYITSCKQNLLLY